MSRRKPNPTKPNQYQIVANQIKGLEQHAKELQLHVLELEEKHQTLSVQQGVLACCCDLLQWLRTGKVHTGWIDCTDWWLPEELTLLQDLGVDSSIPLVQQLQQLHLQQQQTQSHQAHKQQPHSPLLHAAAAGHGNAPAVASSSSLQRPSEQQIQHGLTQCDDALALLERQMLLQLQQTSQEQQQQQQAQGHFHQLPQGVVAPASNCSSTAAMCGAARPGSVLLSQAGAAQQAALTAAAHTGIAAPAPAPPAGSAGAGATVQPVFLTPAGDYLGVLTRAFSLPPYPGAASMTLEQFAEYYAGYVKSLALNLALAEQQAPQFRWQQDGHQVLIQDSDGSAYKRSSTGPSRLSSAAPQHAHGSGTSNQHPLQLLLDTHQQHAGLITSLMMLHKGDLLHRVRVSNLNTLQVEDEAEQAWQRMCWLADRLELREEQQRTIIAGCRLFQHLVDTVLTARQQLLEQQGQQAAMRLPSGRAIDLEGEAGTQQQIEVLIKKELFLVTCASAFITGALDVVQLAKAAVLTWPYPPQMNMLGPVLIQRAEAKVKNLQQQQDRA